MSGGRQLRFLVVEEATKLVKASLSGVAMAQTTGSVGTRQCRSVLRTVSGIGELSQASSLIVAGHAINDLLQAIALEHSRELASKFLLTLAGHFFSGCN